MINRTEQEIMRNWKGDTTAPLVSICTITYNHEKFIAEALDSFLMQETDFPFEMVIDDDCSPDGTAEIIRTYLEKFPTIIKANLREENVGMMQNGMENIKRAKGKYIALCEGDDYWTDPLKLQKQADFLEVNSDYALCYTGATLINDDGAVLVQNKHFGDSSQDELISGIGHAITGSVMYKKFDIGMMSKHNVTNADTLLWHFLGFCGKCKYLENIKNTIYRIHDGGVWSGRSEKSRLEESLKTSAVIRSNIILNFGCNSDLVKRHDDIYEGIFVKYFADSILKLDFKNYLFGVSKLKELKDLKRVRIYLIHWKNIIWRIRPLIKRYF